jgi:hypothetical protein
MVNMAGVVINPEEEFIVVDSTAGVFLEPPPDTSHTVEVSEGLNLDKKKELYSL